MLLFGRERLSRFSASSTTEEVTHEICGIGLTVIAAGASRGISTETAQVLTLCGVRVVMSYF